jgi:hypothetical protein
MRTSLLPLALFLPLLAACSETPPATTPAATTAAPSAAPVVPTTQAQMDLAHFRTTDGVHGFVLDRSGDPIKLRVDGAADVIELTREEDRHGGELRGYWLITPDGKRPVYINKGGSLRYYTGRDEFAVTADRTAEALPAPTVKGKYAPPRPAYQDTADRLTAVAVRTKMAQLKPEDSASLAKVGEALAQASADMFVHFVAGGQDSWLPRAEVVPDQFSGLSYGGVAHQTEDKWDGKGKGLAAWGGVLKGFSEYNSRGNHLNVMHMAGYPGKLAEGTPGIVWEVDGTRAVFVSLDGARYVVDLTGVEKGQTLAPGAGPQAKWPAPLAAALLDVHLVSSYAKAGVMPQKAIDDLTALDDEWNTCAQKTWKGAERKIDSGKFSEADRKDWVLKVEKACKKSVDAQAKLLVQMIEARNKERLALLEKAKARVAAVGADK